MYTRMYPKIMEIAEKKSIQEFPYPNNSPKEIFLSIFFIFFPDPKQYSYKQMSFFFLFLTKSFVSNLENSNSFYQLLYI